VTKSWASSGCRRSSTDAEILATVEFLEEDVYNKSDIVYRMYKEGFLNAWSIGFSANDYDENEFGGYTFKKWELFEFSSVPVPDNPGALTVMRSKGIDVDALLQKDQPVKIEKKEAPKEEKTEEKPEEKKDQPKEETKETDKPKASELTTPR
jgi:Caudovirus prohead serine protease